MGRPILRLMNQLEGPLSEFSTFFFIGGVHIGARAVVDINLICLAISLAYPKNGVEGGILLLQMIST